MQTIKDKLTLLQPLQTGYSVFLLAPASSFSEFLANICNAYTIAQYLHFKQKNESFLLSKMVVPDRDT